MFITKFEKAEIQNAINNLRVSVSDATTEVLYLKAKIKALEEKWAKPVKVKKPKKVLTAAQKAKQRAYQKAYNERQKAKKLAEQLLTQGNPNVSS